MGTIILAISNRFLNNQTKRNIYGNVSYAKTFLQGTVMNVFEGRAPGGKNAIWKLTVDTLGVELKRVTVHCQHCTLGPVPADELNFLTRAGTISDCLCISIASLSSCSHLPIASPPLSPAIVIIVTAVATRRGRGRRRQWPLAS